MSNLIGKAVDRVDGKAKVTGSATYTAEFPLKDLAYGVIVQSTITKGRIQNIDTTAAEALDGVLGVLTYKNSMSLHQLSSSGSPGAGKLGEKDLLPLQNDRIFYNGQHVAVVIAKTFEIAEHGASLVKVTYKEEKPVYHVKDALPEAYQPGQGLGGNQTQVKRGDAEKGLEEAEIKIHQVYTTPVYHHNAMEPHATIAEWKGNELMVYDSTQSVYGSRNAIAQVLGIQPEKLHLISYFIGGGFGSKGFTWPHSFMAPMAAKLVNRPVKIVISRPQMFTSNGRRSETIQEISLGAGKNGKLSSVQHVTTSETSFVEEFIETAGVATKIIYDTPNLDIKQNLVRLNKGTPCPTRAPGEAPGTFALEVAMDELAEQLRMDPVQLRIINYAETNPQTGQQWSSKYLKECYEKGAAAIGWDKRNPAPGSMKEGNFLVGYGMATATYPANRSASSAKIQLFPDGKVVVTCCTQDIGTGTYTILAQIAGEALGVPIEMIEVKLGDSKYPKGPNSGGSQTSASAGPAVRAAALGIKSKLIQLAIDDKRSPLHGQTEKAIAADNGKIYLESEPSKGESYVQVISRNGLKVLEEEVTTNVSTRETQQEEPNPTAKQGGGQGQGGSKQNEAVKQDEEIDRKKYAFHSFGAHFVKVLVDPDLGTVHVAQCTSVMDAGKILNAKTAKNQIMGGIIWGIGMALMEESVYDPNTGRIITRDLANYHVPVHADMPEFDIQFIDKPDPYISPIGSRGIGEIGITGITAAIINAIYHATGKRIRDIPVTPDKLI